MECQCSHRSAQKNEPPKRCDVNLILPENHSIIISLLVFCYHNVIMLYGKVIIHLENKDVVFPFIGKNPLFTY